MTLQQSSLDLIVDDIRQSATVYSHEDTSTEELSHLLFDRLVGNGVSGRIISYTYNNQPFYSVQYYKQGKWHNFDYAGCDMFFQPVYSRTLNPQNVVKVEIIGEYAIPTPDVQTVDYGAIYTIAASNSPKGVKAKADYVCGGVNDAGIIRNVISKHPSGVQINFAEGTFVFKDPLRIGNYTTLKGKGSSTIFKVADNSTFSHLISNETFEEIRFSKIEGILFDGNKQNNAENYINGMFFNKGFWNTFTNIYIQNFTGNGLVLYGNEPGGFCDENVLDNVTVQYCNDNGIYVFIASDNLISNCNLYGNGNGENNYSGAIQLNGGTSNSVLNCNIHTNNNNGIITAWNKSLRVIGCDVRRNGMNGLFTNYDTYSIIQGNTFEGNGSKAISYVRGCGILVYDGIQNILTENVLTNYTGGPQLYGIYMRNADDGLAGPDYFIIKDNVIGGHIASGLVSVGANNIIADNMGI